MATKNSEAYIAVAKIVWYSVEADPLRLVSLMGHASKQMVFEVYGNYVEGLEEDAEQIFE